MAEHLAHVHPRSAVLEDVRIVRACTRCAGPRQEGAPCGGCGDPEPPVVHQLGRQAAHYRNPVRQAWWTLIGAPLAARRAARANAARPAAQ